MSNKMSSPWKKITEPVNVLKITDIMSEEYARVRQNKFAAPVSDSKIISTSDEVSLEILQQIENLNVGENCNSDTTNANDLQCQFDKEHDDKPKLFKEKRSRGTKFPLFGNHCDIPQHLVSESDSENELYTERKDGTHFKTNAKKTASLLKRYIVTKDGRMVTKPDNIISRKRSSCRVMAFPPDLCTEDGAEFHMKMSNPVLNQLNMHTMWDQACMPKMFDHKESQLPKDTAEMGLDVASKIILYKLINNRMLLDITGVIATGKESVVLHANCDPSYPEMVLPKECAIKVFNTALDNFRGRNKFAEPEYRFKDSFSTKISEVVHMWTEKEKHTLIKIQKLGLNCPEIICLDKNVLVMSFIGKDSKPALMLRDVLLKPDEWQSVYTEVVRAMHMLYHVGHLILADLSELNILWWENKCWFIDVAQSVQSDHHNAFKFLQRACDRVVYFFKKKGVTGMKTPEELFKFITDLEDVGVTC